MNSIKLSLLIAVFSLFTNLTAQLSEQTKWGATLNEIKQSSLEELVEESDNVLAYKTKIFNENATLLYFFTNNNELYQFNILFEDAYKDSTLSCLDLFLKIENDLIEAYGGGPNKMWKSENRRDTIPENKLTEDAVADGQLQFKSIWYLEKTVVILRYTALRKNPAVILL